MNTKPSTPGLTSDGNGGILPIVPTNPPIYPARTLVQRLIASGLSPVSISDALGARVSPRTVYRWAKGDSAPQRASDRVALERLAQTLVLP
jgi:hypothetical protein